MPPLVQRLVPLAQQVQDILIERIKDGAYPAGSKIPPETDLATEFNVSRATIRSALSTLAAQGLVTRRQGAGTFVSQLAPITNPLDRAIDFQKLITSYGYRPGVQHVHTSAGLPTPAIAEALQLEPDVQVIVSHKVFSADDQPVIYCINTIPGTYLNTELFASVLASPGQLEPLYGFFEEHCGQRIELHVAKIRAVAAGTSQFHGGLPLDPQEPVLVIDAIAYDGNMQPLFHTFEYHHHPDDAMTLEFVRHRW